MREARNARAARPNQQSKWSDLVAAYRAVGTERSWFAEQAIEGAPLAMFVGPEKAGKSWVIQQLIVATVLGLPWLGRFPVQRTGSVVVLDGEYGAVEFSRRLARLARGYGRAPSEVLPCVRHLTPYALLRRDSKESINQDLHALLADLTTDPPALIVVDPLRNQLVGSENEAHVAQDALHCLNVLRKAAEVPIVIVHHLNKQGGYSGSRALRARADLWIEGTDDQRPTYTTIGRTLRDGDLITKPFEVAVEHHDDSNDAKARTVVAARFRGESRAKAALSSGALRVRDVLQGAATPLSVRAIRELTKMNGRTVPRHLQELASAGIAVREGSGWTLSTSAFFEGMKRQHEGGS